MAVNLLLPAAMAAVAVVAGVAAAAVVASLAAAVALAAAVEVAAAAIIMEPYRPRNGGLAARSPDPPPLSKRLARSVGPAATATNR